MFKMVCMVPIAFRLLHIDLRFLRILLIELFLIANVAFGIPLVLILQQKLGS